MMTAMMIMITTIDKVTATATAMMTTTMATAMTVMTTTTTDLHIYNLDTVPPADVVWNDAATDKLTTQDGDKFRTGAGVVADVRATPLRLTPVLPRHTT